VCGGHIIGDEGTIQSPRFPENYAPDANCNWVITVPKKFQVALTFQYFNILYMLGHCELDLIAISLNNISSSLETHKDCVYDRVEIYDGAVAEPNNLLSKLCGQVTAESVISNSNVVLVRFVSDSSVQKSGFHIDFVRGSFSLRQKTNLYFIDSKSPQRSSVLVLELDECASDTHGCEQRCVNQIGGFRCECDIGFSLRPDGKTCQSTCGGVIKATNGTFFSPNFPLNYPPMKNCVWQVEADEGYQIIVNFTHFNVEGMKTECAYDYVLIEDEGGALLRDYTQPLVYTSTSNRIKAHFVSDNSVEKSGFAAYFIKDLDECRKDKGGCQQLCVNTIGSYRCECESGYVLADDGHNCKEGGCHSQLHDPDGEITSPNFPMDYPKGKTCNWHFVTTPGHRLLLSFEEFALEEHNMCKYDHVEVFDGGDAQAPSLGVFCGNGVPPDISSSSNQLFLTMVTDASVARRGFKAFYSSGKCEWRIIAEAGRGVELRFAQFDLEKEANCEFDYVEVFDGLDRSDEHKMGHFCGDELPPVFVSTGKKMLLVLNTDDSEERKGFVAEYRSSAPATARPVTKPTPPLVCEVTLLML
uniref:Tolloid n=2 Tax=Toxocara canis TaxID=6265 RepID=A0A183VCE0_TOXCA